MQKAAANDRRRNIKNSVRSFFSFAGFILTVVIAAALINNFVFQSYYVDGSSMTPTLENDDRLIIDKIGKTVATVQGQPYIPERGQIVVLDSSLLDQYGRNEQLIKRVIGLPGDTITIRDGTVTIKNKEHPEGFNVDQNLKLAVEPTYSASPIQVTIAEGELYVLGDNRIANGSFDSRSFGPITSDKIQGHLIARIFPFDRVQFY